jgi:hypothetical protein
MNSSLEKLYSSKWGELSEAFKNILDNDIFEIKPTNPLLLKIADEDSFRDADIRLMIYGQETNSWGEQFNPNINSTIEIYDEFFNSDYCFTYGGQFWNGISRFLSLLQKKYPDKTIRFVWNDIVKIGKYADKGFPPEYIYKVERECFSVIKEELEIIKPNVILFLTGPNYDSVIADNFGNLNYRAIEPFSGREISEITVDGFPNSFRTYHPNYLWRNDIDFYFETIINRIKI